HMAGTLAGRVALVTGSSRGIGKVLALRLADEGADIVVCARSDMPTELPGTIGETAAAIEEKGRQALALRLDLEDDQSVDAAIEASVRGFGRIDILVNNAVLVTQRLPFIGGNAEFLDRAFRVNVRSPYRMTQRISKLMSETGGGAIINVTSGSAKHNPPPTGPITERELDALDPSYGITKAAFDRMTTAYASELMAKNISIVSVSPGLVITERIRLAAIRRNVDFDRAESPDVIASAVALLAREGMKYTGQILSAKDLLAEATAVA
ncbi:MAG: SDR family NAD(P)-dependent oxidoreductase, partial [Acidimicrobiaceae bacterium]|nr:SDR family NAD(P)-dependent oxidoreductase [Acidimicrobiaceae bacterium]